MKQSDRASPSFGFTGQSVRASPFSGFATQSVRASLWAYVTGQSDITSPWVRVTGQTVRDLRCSQWPVSNDLERSSKDQAKQSIASRPWDFQWSTTRTGQGIWLLTILVLAEGGSFGQAKQHLSWTSHFLKNSRCHKRSGYPDDQSNTYNATPEPGYIVRQSLGSFISDSWPRGGRLPEREPSQLVLDQLLNQACKAVPIHTQFWPISLSWDWRTSVV